MQTLIREWRRNISGSWIFDCQYSVQPSKLNGCFVFDHRGTKIHVWYHLGTFYHPQLRCLVNHIFGWNHILSEITVLVTLTGTQRLCKISEPIILKKYKKCASALGELLRFDENQTGAEELAWFEGWVLVCIWTWWFIMPFLNLMVHCFTTEPLRHCLKNCAYARIVAISPIRGIIRRYSYSFVDIIDLFINWSNCFTYWNKILQQKPQVKPIVYFASNQGIFKNRKNYQYYFKFFLFENSGPSNMDTQKMTAAQIEAQMKAYDKEFNWNLF